MTARPLYPAAWALIAGRWTVRAYVEKPGGGPVFDLHAIAKVLALRTKHVRQASISSGRFSRRVSAWNSKNAAAEIPVGCASIVQAMLDLARARGCPHADAAAADLSALYAAAIAAESEHLEAAA